MKFHFFTILLDVCALLTEKLISRTLHVYMGIYGSCFERTHGEGKGFQHTMKNFNRCPNCNRPLPAIEKHCLYCGQPFEDGVGDEHIASVDSEQLPVVKSTPPRRRKLSARGAAFLRPGSSRPPRLSLHGSHDISAQHNPLTLEEPDYEMYEEEFDDSPDSLALATDAVQALRPEPQPTWQRVVESAESTPPSYPPKPTIPPGARVATIPPVTTSSKTRPPFVRRYVKFRLLFWGLSALLVIVLTTVGVLAAMGNGLLGSKPKEPLSLVVSPHEVSIGATLSLRGKGFSANGHAGLSRDSAIPIGDTAGASVVRADEQGHFSDTVVVQADWGVGAHTINAEDALTHKLTSYPILVVGKSAPLRPAHLKVSTTTLSLGTGDQATNSKQTVTLTNLGSGQITWQGMTTQSWLKISPEQGTFYSGMQHTVTVAVDRGNLSPGKYDAQVLFTSNAGNTSLKIQAEVTQLDPSHKAVLQLTPALLSFSAVDGGKAPTPQVVTVSNPGVLPLDWTLRSSVSWLSLSDDSGRLASQESATLKVNINTSTLLPGTYHASIIFGALDPEKTLHVPQSIDVSVTVTPRCSMTLTPSMLSFTAAYQQPAPLAKTITVGTSNSCQSTLNWHVTSSAGWLTTTRTSGTTPSTFDVGIDMTGLTPGHYNETLTFDSQAGSHILLVDFVLGPANKPVIAVDASAFPFQGIANTNDAPVQTMTLTNTGGGMLSWSVGTETSGGGNWLSATPKGGTLGAQQSAQITVKASVLPGQKDGAYSGVIKLTGSDANGRAATGSPFNIPATFTVRPACSLIVDQPALIFNAAGGQQAPADQTLKLTTRDTCGHPLSWTTQSSGGSWLSATSSGKASATSPASVNVSVSLAGLPLDVKVYTASLVLGAQDSVTHASVGVPVPVAVTLNMQPACTLQSPSITQASFTTVTGKNPSPQTAPFTIGVTGTCAGNVTVTPSLVKNSSWLTVTPVSATATTTSSASFTITINATTLAVGQYTDTVSLTGLSGGLAIISSPQKIDVTLNVGKPPTLSADPEAGGLTYTQATGAVNKVITLSNTGTGSLNWTAALQSGAPGFVSLSATSGTGLTQGSPNTVTVTVDTTGQASGTFTTAVIISATDTASQAAAGSPVTLPVTITIPSPALQLSATALAFTTTEGSDPAAKTVRLSNAGGGTLTWSTSSSQSWLTVTPASGSNPAQSPTSLSFQIKASGLVASATDYTATVTVTPNTGSPLTISVSLTVNAAPTPMPTPTPTGGWTPSAGGGTTPTNTPPPDTPTASVSSPTPSGSVSPTSTNPTATFNPPTATPAPTATP